MIDEDRIHTDALDQHGDPVISRSERRHYRNVAARRKRKRRRWIEAVREKAREHTRQER